MTFAASLSNYLRRENLMACEFAAAIGASKSSVSRYLSGEREPRGKTLRKIIKLTGGKVRPSREVAS